MDPIDFMKSIIVDLTAIKILGNAEWKKQRSQQLVLKIEGYLKKREKENE